MVDKASTSSESTPRESIGEFADDEAEAPQEVFTGNWRMRSTLARFQRTAWQMKECLFVVFLFWSCQWVDTDIAGGFYRSIMFCDQPVPSADNRCPIGTMLHTGDSGAHECMPVARGEAEWSGSAHCFDQEYVVRRSTQFGGRLSTLAIVGQLLSNLFISTTLIDTIGRKPVMLMALVGWCVLCAMFAIASQLKRTELADCLHMTMLCVSFFNSFAPASIAMASDLSCNTEVERSLAMTLLHAARSAGTLSGFVGGFFILKNDLEDYNGVWTVMCAVVIVFTIIASLVLRETIPNRRFSLSCATNRCLSRSPVRSIFVDIGAAFRIVWREPYLRYTLIPSHILGGASAAGCLSMAGGWGISICKYPQEISSTMGIVQPGMIVIGSLTSSVLVPVIGPYFSGLIGGIFCTAGFAITGMGAFFIDKAPMFWWLGFGLMAGFGQGMCTPCINGIASIRVAGAAEQGKLFAISTLSAGVGAGLGLFIFSNLLFKNGSDNTSLELASGWLVGAALVVITLAINVLAYIAYVRPERLGTAKIQGKKGRRVHALPAKTDV